MAAIIKELINNIGTITLNNPEKRNALSKTLLSELVSALDDFAKNKARVVIIRAPAGSKVWSSGHDVKELKEIEDDPLSYDYPLEKAIRVVEDFPSPVIAFIEGSVWGGACELVFTCDILIATPESTLAITPAKLGVPYNPTGIMHFLNMFEMSVIKEMFFTAQPITAQRAEVLGIINHVHPPDKIENFVYEMAERIAFNSPLAISVIKEQLRMLGKSRPLNPDTFEKIQMLRRIVYDSKDYKEGINAFLEKRPPEFIGE